MGETEILSTLQKERGIWWHDLLGQKPSFDNFDMDKAIATLPRTEVKAAEAIHERYANVLTYTEARNQWYLWDGRIHTPCDGDGVAIKVAKELYRELTTALEFIREYLEKEAIKIEASNTATAKDDAKKMRAYYDKGEIAKHKRFRDDLSKSAGQAALIRTLKTELDVDSTYYDDDQRWLVVQNGVFDLDEIRNGGWGFYPHSPDRNVTKFFDAPYRAEAMRSNFKHWDTFLKYSIPSDAAREYLQKVTGAAFMGESKLRTILNLHGPPGSGKSVFIGTFFKLGKGGAGYSVMPDSKAIIKVSGQNFEQDSMRGARFVGVSEPPMGDAIDNEFLKKVTGDDWVETRTLNVKSSGWTPQCVIFVASNKALKINTRDKAIVERVQMIEFPVEFEAGEHVPIERRRVKGLEQLIMDDRERVLEWVIQGMLKYVADGRQLTPPEEVTRLQSEVVTESSTALRWMSEYIEEGLLEIKPDQPAQYFLPINDAYQRYQSWVIMAGEKHPLTKRFFAQDIENHYAGKIKDGDQWRFKNITVTPEFRRLYSANGAAGIANPY